MLDESEYLHPFLKYQDAVVLPRDEPIAAFQMMQNKRAKPPLAVAKLNAAKASAREAFLASQESDPVHGSTSRSEGGSGRGQARTRNKGPSGSQARKNTSVAAPADADDASSASAISITTDPKVMLPALMKNVRDSTQILYALFPPIMVPIDAKESAVHFVSTTQAGREEVVLLHDKLVDRLEKRYARISGCCPIRRAIYDDVLCELIRQLTLEEPARGVLLQRLKDESHKSLRVHADLAQRSDYFSSRKLLSCSDGIKEMEDTIENLQSSIASLQDRLHTLDKKRRAVERKYDEQRQERIKPQQDELGYWRRANQQLSLRLKNETEKAAAANNDLEVE